MSKFKYLGMGIAIGLILSQYILSTAPAFNFFGKHFICAEVVDEPIR